VKEVEYVGEPPFAFLRLRDEKLEKLVDVELEAFSPFIPGDVKNSSLPVAIFRFRIRNRSGRRLEVTLVAGVRSPSEAKATAKSDRATLTMLDTDPTSPLYGGSMTLRVVGGETAAGIIVARHPMVTYYAVCREFVDMWVELRGSGRISGRREYSGRDAWGVAASRHVIEPGGEAETIFVLTWFFPNHLDEDLEKLGHYYENFFGNAEDVSDYVVENFRNLYARTREFHDLVYGVEGVEKWVADLAASQLTTFLKGTWLTKDGRFGLWEGLGHSYFGGPEAAAFNTTDVMTYVLPTLITLFPQLAKRYIEQNAEHLLSPDSPMYIVYALAIPENREEFLKEFEKDPSIASDLDRALEVVRRIVKKTGKDPAGRVMHYFARSLKRVDAYHMVEIMPKFVLSAYLISLWTGDRELLAKLRSSMEGAAEALLRTQSIDGVLPYHTYPAGFDWASSLVAQGVSKGLADRFAQLLPLLMGQRLVPMGFQTFDVWTFYGVAAYTSILWLAALRALEETCRSVGRDASRYRELYERALKRVYDYLWNGSYFDLWHDPVSGSRDRACMAAQLLGQWLATLSDLGYVVDREKVKKTLRSIASNNIVEEEGLINGVYPGGRRPAWHGATTYDNRLGLPFTPGSQMDTPWSGVEFAVASHMLYEKFVENALKLLRIVHERYEVSGQYWNHIEWGTHYMRPLSSWSHRAGSRRSCVQRLREEAEDIPRGPQPHLNPHGAGSMGQDQVQ
ncbi:MAG: hypothetical protein DRO39_04005, partial [Thermoprotei archaeon]